MAQELYSVYRTQSEYDVAYLVHPPRCEKPSGDEGESGVSDEETAVDEDESVTDSHGNLDIIDTFTHPREAIEPQVSTPRPIEYDSISRTPPQDQFIRGRISKCMIEPMSKETSRDRHDMMFAMKVMYSRQGNKFWKKERDPLNLLQGIRPQKGLRGEYLWIDALCIDQTKSRSHKVEAYRTMFSEKHAMNDLLRHSLSQHSGASYRGGDYCLTWDIHLDSGWKDMDDREPRKWEHDTPWSSDNEKETAIGSAVLTSPLLAHRESPSTFLFGLSGLLYATAVMLQYRVNRRDVYQYLCVPIGIMTGVFVLVTSTCFACEGPTVASTLALCVSVVMMLSVSMHTVWRTLISSRTAQLQHKINKWMEESELESAGPEKRVLFYEIS
ncbi:unnamed protein product [Alternaria alternata]